MGSETITSPWRRVNQLFRDRGRSAGQNGGGFGRCGDSGDGCPPHRGSLLAAQPIRKDFHIYGIWRLYVLQLTAGFLEPRPKYQAHSEYRYIDIALVQTFAHYSLVCGHVLCLFCGCRSRFVCLLRAGIRKLHPPPKLLLVVGFFYISVPHWEFVPWRNSRVAVFL